MVNRLHQRITVYLILADENLFHPHYLEGIINYAKKSNYTVSGITIAKDTYPKGFGEALMKQISLWGVFPFVFIALSVVGKEFFTRVGLAKRKTIYSVAKEENIPCIESYNVNDVNHIALLKKKKVDIIISSCGHIFKKELLHAPKISCINRHSSLLPEYGGILPVFWAMLNNERNIGVSVHKMVEKIDQGDILAQVKIKNEKHNSLFCNYILAFDISAKVTDRAIKRLLENKVFRKFSHNKNEYYSFPSSDAIKKFKQKHSTFSLGDVKKYFSIIN